MEYLKRMNYYVHIDYLKMTVSEEVVNKVQ